MIPKPMEVLTPLWSRQVELGAAPILDEDDRCRRKQCRIPFHEEYIGIINDVKAVTLAAVELSLEPASPEKATRLKAVVRSLKRRGSRLTYKLAKASRIS